jgi:transcriptional regulator with XRE-family HTH domain
MNHYEWLDLNIPDLPPKPSDLFSIEPIGLDTHLVESLTGYISRLAETHCLTTGNLISKKITPLLNKIYLNNIAKKGGNGFYDSSSSLNGNGYLALDFIDVLEKLTYRTDLKYTTMLVWDQVIPTKGLNKSTKAWCPLCFEEQVKKYGVVYEPLIWSLQVISVCGVHQLPLRTTCTACNSLLPMINRKSRSGFCSKCGKWLGAVLEKTALVEEDHWELWKFNTVGELLQMARTVALPVRDNIYSFLKKYIENHSDINIAGLARELGIPKVTFWDWVSGKNIPTLDGLLKISYGLDIKLVSIVTGDFPAEQPIRKTHTVYVHQNKERESSKLTEAMMHYGLDSLLMENEYPPPSMEEVADRLKVDKRILYLSLPDQCKHISNRYLEYVKERSSQRVNQLSHEVIEAVSTLTAKGSYPSRRKTEQIMNRPAALKEEKIQKVWKEAILKIT